MHSRSMFTHWSYVCTRCCFTSSNLSRLPLFQKQIHTLQSSRSPFISIQGLRNLSSKTSSSNSAVVAQAKESNLSNPSPEDLPTPTPSTPPPEFIPHFSGQDIREMDDETRQKIHKASSEIASAQSASLVNPEHIWRRKEILVMDESEYKDTLVLKRRPHLLARLGEDNSYFFGLLPEKKNPMDTLIFMQQDIDLRPKSIRKWVTKTTLEQEIDSQRYNAKRSGILGSELSAAHFILFRKGKVKFLGQPEWITEYRKDAKPGEKEEDLPVMKMELCTLPTKYDPRWRLEAIDATGVTLHYEGLSNFENLNYLKYLSLRESPYIDDWCLDRISRLFAETLEYIDLSGCKNITDKGIGALHRCSNLKGMCVENLPHLENLEVVCAMLEDHNPNLQVIGVNYEAKTMQLQLEGEELERKALESEQQASEKLKLISAEPGPLEKSKSSSEGGETTLDLNHVKT